MPDRRRLGAEKRAAKRRKLKKRRAKRALFLMAELLVLAILGGTAYVMVKYDKFQTIAFGDDDIKQNEGVQKEGYMTIALFGGDSREGALEEGAHADTIILASINNATKEVRLASVYRDTLTEQVDGKMQKANYAYFAGGPKDAINMLNKNFDLDISNYVTVDFKALADVVDLLGGIEVDVTDKEAAEVNNYIDETGSVAGKKANHLTSGGRQTLDGVQAVTYARIRHNVGGDFKRTERQRIVITKVAEKAKTTDLATINKIIDKVFPQISTSFSLSDLIGLASGALDYEMGDTSGFPMEAVNGSVKGIGSVVISVGVAENVQELHAFLYPDEEPKEPSETVEKIAAQIEGLTGITRDELEKSPDSIVRSSHGAAKE